MKLKLLIFILIFVISCGETMPLKEYKDASSLREKAVKYELQDYSKDIKAYKIDKENYELAELYYINGVEAFGTNNYEEAVNYFLQAKKLHNKAYFSTKGIFDESSKSIKEAELKIKEMEEIEKYYTNNYNN